MNVEDRLRTVLLPVLGLDSPDEIPLEASLVKDLGADSLDFVEITYLIEKEFGVVIKTRELVPGGVLSDVDALFVENKLTEQGAEAIRRQLPDRPDRFRAGMTKVQLFQALSVQDLARIIREKLEARGA